MRPGNATCVICDTLLTLLQERNGKLCGDPRCGRKYRDLPPDRVCPECGRPLAMREPGGRPCSRVACRKAVVAESNRKKREEQRRDLEARRAEAADLRDREAGAAGVGDPRSFPVVVLPSNPTPLTPLPEERREKFRRHLAELFAEARERPFDTDGPLYLSDVAPPPRTLPVLGAGCGQCGGHCCRNGRDHAYQTPDEVRAYLAAHPDQTPDEVLEAYVSYLDGETHEWSCVYHRRDGCALPREMRSSTCNGYFCGGLKEFLDVVPEDGPARVFFAAAGGGEIRAAAFIDEDGVRPVRVPTPPEPT